MLSVGVITRRRLPLVSLPKLTFGDMASAQEYGAQGVTIADRSWDGVQMELNRTIHADALHQAGDNQAAKKLFIEAEKMQKKRKPEYPWLFSLPGFQFCDYLLSTGKYQEVQERLQTIIKYENESWYNLLSIALDKLTIGKVNMLLGNFAESEKYLNQAIDGLREAGRQDCAPWGLLARANLFRHLKYFLKSWADLDEGREIAAYGEMRLHLTDYHLEACRTIGEQLLVNNSMGSAQSYLIIEDGESLHVSNKEMQEKFREHFMEAERLITETGYHRRDQELEALRKEI